MVIKGRSSNRRALNTHFPGYYAFTYTIFGVCKIHL
nr:MAG TPA: hypothetical protein [Caudoviricetes sp.]